MNPTKHPRFIKELPAANLLLSETCPLAEVIVETLVFAGIDPDQPVYTADGDRVRLLCVDHDHQFPIVGEVIDFGAETSWLARWSASGLYAGGSQQSIARHSLSQNAPLGGIVEPACGCVVSHEVHVEVDFGLPPLFIVPVGPLTGDVDMVDLAKIRVTPADIAREALKPPLQQCWRIPEPQERGYPRSGTAETAMADGPSGTEISPGQKWAVSPAQCVRQQSHFRDTRAVPGGIECTGCGAVRHFVQSASAGPTLRGLPVADSVLSDWPLPLGAEVQAESAEVIGRAKRAVAKWTRDHAEYPNLRALVAPLLDLSKIEEATTDAHLTPTAHLWSLVAFYAMAGRLRLGGEGPKAVASLTPVDLQRIVNGCKRVGPNVTYGYFVGPSPDLRPIIEGYGECPKSKAA